MAHPSTRKNLFREKNLNYNSSFKNNTRVYALKHNGVCMSLKTVSITITNNYIFLDHRAFQSFKKDRHFQTKTDIKNWLPLICSINIVAYTSQILASFLKF